MSLRLRLVLLIVALIVLVSLALSIVYLQNLIRTLSNDVFDRTTLAAQQVNRFIIDHVTAHSGEYEVPPDLEATKKNWIDIVATDPDIPPMLRKMFEISPAIVEINIAGPDGQILTSTDPARIGKTMTHPASFDNWRQGSLIPRLRRLINRRPGDYEFTLPLGLQGEASPLFTVQLIASSVFLRDAVVPPLQTLVLVAGAALLVSLILTLLATNQALRPLKRIEATIDRIVQGNYPSGAADAHRDPAKEFAIVESKLNLLGERFRGARDQTVMLQHNLDKLLERMATELDVASRLAAISRITGGVAHEIKNPLNAISLRLDLLRARLGDTEEHLVPEIDVLSKEVTRLDRVVKTFLDFSRPVEVNLQEVDLTSLVREVGLLTAPQAKLAGIKMHFDAPRVPAMIRADADLLKQAILNLVINAIEAMKDEGNIWLTVAVEPNIVVLEVADDGPGIPEELREKVFQLYFSTKQRGSGIGLAMTYRAVQLHNGTITFTSEPDRGTTFVLQFPALVRSV